MPATAYFKHLIRVYLKLFLLQDNGSKNSILNWVLKLNFVQQCWKMLLFNKAFNFDIACISPAFWLEIFILFKCYDYTNFNLVGEWN